MLQKMILIQLKGQERFRSLAPMYYKGSKAAVVVYDITTYVKKYPITFSNRNFYLRKPSKEPKNGIDFKFL